MRNVETQRKLRAARAFTLVEMMVAVALMTVIVAIAATVFKETSEVFSVTRNRVEIYQNARAILDRLETEMRMAFLDNSGNRFVGYDNSDPGGLPDTRMGGTDSLWFNTMSEYLSSDAPPVKSRGHQAFYYLDDQLVFRKFLSTDLTNTSLGTADELGFNVWNFQLQYFDRGDTVGQASWDSSSTGRLPVAVRVTLCLSDSDFREKQTLVRMIAIG